MSAAGALCVHAALLLSETGIRGGADLQPHLHLMQEMAEAPGLRTVYAPLYHVFGALVFPWAGLAATTKLFAFAAAAALIAGFRSFQRAAALPDVAAAVFAWSPYTFALTWCTPKVEVAGYALAFAALGLLLRRRYAALALALAVTFLVHTAAALFLGLGAGILALALRDRRAVLALTAGTVAAAPLLLSHVAAGCSAAEALLFSPGDYLRTADAGRDLGNWARILVFAGPIGLAAAALGVPALWHRNRPVAALCAAIALLYLNELWLAPLGVGSTLNLQRGLTLLAFATAVCAGVALASRPRIAPAVVAACAVWSLAAVIWSVPNACYIRSFTLEEVSNTRVERCRFRWRNAIPRAGLPRNPDPLPGR